MFPKSIEQVSVTIDGTCADGWSSAAVVRFEIPEVPVHAVGLHYGQIAFEALRARWRDGSFEIFRPELHWQRLCRSMSRFAIPPIDWETFDRALSDLMAAVDTGPSKPDEFLYVRPLVIATDADWGMGGSQSFRLLILAGWTREAFQHVPRVVALVEAERRRTWPGGTGDVKVPANYGPAFAAQAQARRVGAHTVLWLEPDHRHVEEFTSMNALFLGDDGELNAPAPGSTVLDGVTRRSVIEIARDIGVTVNEAPFPWARPRDDHEDIRGTLLASGTATGLVVVDEVKELGADGKMRSWLSSRAGEAMAELREQVRGCYWDDARPEWWISPGSR